MAVSKKHVQSFWNKFWKDKDGHVVLIQAPNVWIILWFVAEVVSLMGSSKNIANIGHIFAIIALGVWSLLELFKGVNYFRRTIGFIFASITILSVLGRGI